MNSLSLKRQISDNVLRTMDDFVSFFGFEQI